MLPWCNAATAVAVAVIGGSGMAAGGGWGWAACWGASVAGGAEIVDVGESWRTPE